MSEKEKSGGPTCTGSSLVVVEKTASSRHKPYRPTELEDKSSGELHQKRSKAPAVPSIAEDLKVPEDVTVVPDKDTQDPIENKSERALSPDKLKHKMAKKLSTNTKKRESSPETLTMTSTATAPVKGATPVPIPPDVESIKRLDSVEDIESKDAGGHKSNEDITDEIAELGTPEADKKHSEWSDDEEAGGLPRSGSRSSRVSRAMRQLFCCGVRYQARSEDNISDGRDFPSSAI